MGKSLNYANKDHQILSRKTRLHGGRDGPDVCRGRPGSAGARAKLNKKAVLEKEKNTALSNHLLFF